jgi:hypothetical protein
MPKTKISEFSATPASNTDIDSINISEGCAPSGINDAIRELMAQLKDFQVGSAGDPVTVGGVLTVQAGAVGTPAITTAGDTNTGIFFPAADTIAFAEGGAEAMRLDSSGNMGIGTSSPVSRLDVAGASGVAVNVANTSDSNRGGKLVVAGSSASGTFAMNTTSSGYGITFGIDSTEKMRLDTSGNLGLGVTPTQAYSTSRAIQLGNGGLIEGRSNDSTTFSLASNAYLSSGGDWTYSSNNRASLYTLTNGSYTWQIAAAGTGAITFTTAMSLTTGGNLLVGDTTSAYSAKIYANGIIAARNSGVDGSFQNAFIAGYSSNYNEINAIQSAVSSGGTESGWRFQASVGGGSGTTYKTLDSLRDVTIFYTQNTERVRINNNGRFLLGRSSTRSGELSSFTGSPDDGGWTIESVNTRSSGTLNGVISYFPNSAPNNATSAFYQGTDGTSRFEVRSNGGIANYSANNVNLSDRREKTNFAPSKSYLDVICSIPVQTFNYIDQNLEEDAGLTLGVVAQDVQAIAPELVMESNWGTEEDPKMRLSIYQTDLQYALMKCIQEQQAIIESLKARLDAANL